MTSTWSNTPDPEPRRNVVIADRGLRRMYHPYDGGADVLALDTAERDALRERHADWLSKHPSGM